MDREHTTLGTSACTCCNRPDVRLPSRATANRFPLARVASGRPGAGPVVVCPVCDLRGTRMPGWTDEGDPRR